MKKIICIFLLGFIISNINAQNDVSLASKLKEQTIKGDYIVLELRLNKEGEFRTMEGGASSLARIALYTGKNNGKEILTKNFGGMNGVVKVLNELKRNDWQLIDTYSLKGEMLLITHYVLERKK
ncbi:MAG: hypothetical protein ACPGSL_03570 [Vicingaceae bacterium]